MEVTNEGVVTYKTRGLEAGEAAGSEATLRAAENLGRAVAAKIGRDNG